MNQFTKSTEDLFTANSKVDLKKEKQNRNMKFQPPRGTKDFLAEEMVLREYILNNVKNIFEKYGFEPLDTPAFEKFELLATKSGEDVIKQIFQFKDKGGRDLGLRFDLTVPMARVVASNPQLLKPYKRYAIGPAWRYEEPQSGRMRQFYQADIDICGSNSMGADVECIACAVDCFKSLGFKEFAVRINNRKILDGIMELVGVKKERNLDIFRIIDKMDKIGEDGVRKELEKAAFTEKQIEKLFGLISKKGNFIEMLNEGKKILKGIKIAEDGIKELEEIYSFSKCYGISKFVALDFSLARGLDYYTGPIFELVEETEKLIGTLAAGGRYDNLIEQFGGRPTPATGISLGIERMFQLMKERKILELEKTKVKVFVANVDERIKIKTIEIAQQLREKGINCQTDLMNRNLTKQLEYADNLGIPFVVIVGEKEIKKKKLKLKDMKKKTEKEMNIQNILRILK